MKVLVCVKQVPDMESVFRTDGTGRRLEEGDLAFRMNEYDEYAVEQALLLKEQLGGEPDVTILSIGPQRVTEILRKGLAMGCDRALHVHDPALWPRDPWQIASLIASFARHAGFDLIFTGMQSQDRASAQVGVTVAEILGIAAVSTVVCFRYHEGVITVRRELEGGERGVVQLRPPAVITCQLGLNVPRYPTLPNIIRARNRELLTIPVEELLPEKERTETLSLAPPAARGCGIVLEGDIPEMASHLVQILREKTTVVRGGRGESASGF